MKGTLFGRDIEFEKIPVSRTKTTSITLLSCLITKLSCGLEYDDFVFTTATPFSVHIIDKEKDFIINTRTQQISIGGYVHSYSLNTMTCRFTYDIHVNDMTIFQKEMQYVLTDFL